MLALQFARVNKKGLGSNEKREEKVQMWEKLRGLRYEARQLRSSLPSAGLVRLPLPVLTAAALFRPAPGMR